MIDFQTTPFAYRRNDMKQKSLKIAPVSVSVSIVYPIDNHVLPKIKQLNGKLMPMCFAVFPIANWFISYETWRAHVTNAMEYVEPYWIWCTFGTYGDTTSKPIHECHFDGCFACAFFPFSAVVSDMNITISSKRLCDAGKASLRLRASPMLAAKTFPISRMKD